MTHAVAGHMRCHELLGFCHKCLVQLAGSSRIKGLRICLAFVCLLPFATMPAQSTLRSSKRVKMVHPGLLPQQMMGMMGMHPMMAGGMHPAALQQQQVAAMAAMNPALSAGVHDEGEDSEEADAEDAQSSAAAQPSASVDTRKATTERDANGQQSETISRNVTFLKNVARWRLAEGLEWLHADFDATLTHGMTQEGILGVLYMCTRLKPSTKVSDLRVLVKFFDMLFACDYMD